MHVNTTELKLRLPFMTPARQVIATPLGVTGGGDHLPSAADPFAREHGDRSSANPTVRPDRFSKPRNSSLPPRSSYDPTLLNSHITGRAGSHGDKYSQYLERLKFRGGVVLICKAGEK